MEKTATMTLHEFVELLSTEAGAGVTAEFVREDTTFDEIDVDSLALLGVIALVERDWQIRLPDDAEHLRSIGEFLNLINDSISRNGTLRKVD